jgi:hypothetical protein
MEVSLQLSTLMLEKCAVQCKIFPRVLANRIPCKVPVKEMHPKSHYQSSIKKQFIYVLLIMKTY